MRDVFETVPPVLRESAYALGATTWEVVWNIVLPYTRVGVVGGIMLGLGRALGETMAVTFVIGNAHRISASLLAPGTTISAAIANEFTEAVGDLYLSSLIALGLLLFVITFIVLAIAKLMLHAAPEAGGDLTHERLYARRRVSNTAAIGASVAATAIGLFWLAAILWTLLTNGIDALGLDLFTQNDAAARQQRRPAERDLRQLRDDPDRDPDRHADRHTRRHLSRRVRPGEHASAQVDPLRQRHPAERAVDHHRPVRLRGDGGADAALLGLGRRGRARDHRRPGRRAHDRGHAEPGAAGAARGGGGAGHAAVEGDHRMVSYRAALQGMLTGVLLAVARISGETAPLLFTALNNQFWSTDLNAPMANLPVVIFQFALSPYEDWQRIAWAARFSSRSSCCPEHRGTRHRIMEQRNQMSMDMSTAAAVRAQPALRAQVMPTRPVAANGSSKPRMGRKRPWCRRSRSGTCASTTRISRR